MRPLSAVADAGVAHALAHHAQQEVGARPEQGRIDGEAGFDVGVGEDGAAGGHPPDQGQFMPWGGGAACLPGEAQAAMPRQALQRALAHQGFDIVLR